MVSLSNGDGRRSGGYAFEDDEVSDDNNSDVADNTPLLDSQRSEPSSSRHLHIITGYLSALEVFIMLAYTGMLVGFTVPSLLTSGNQNQTMSSYHQAASVVDAITEIPIEESEDWLKLLVAVFCMAHTLLWVYVFLTDRFVQWRHQVMRRMGYLKFYRQMKNIRRVPFLVTSLTNAVLLLFMSLLYVYNVRGNQVFAMFLNSTYTLYIIIGVEVIVSVPCLLYYIVRAFWFNYMKQPPDVIRETNSVSNSPTNTLTTVGFREGEDVDELLERQADMIRYLQQHTASLGRRIMELQSRTLE